MSPVCRVQLLKLNFYSGRPTGMAKKIINPFKIERETILGVPPLELVNNPFYKKV